MKWSLPVGTFLAVGSLAALSWGANTVWIETERFDDHGGWTSDAQFIDQMGSPYLLAVGLGKPAGDAVATVTLPKAGSYRLWVRTKDWMPEHHPGKFQILLNGKPAKAAFGNSGKSDWHWENGGVHPLAEKVELRLHDLTGYYGRCDAILLTDDLDWTPPRDKEAIAKLRQQSGGISRGIEKMPPHDVVVVGGGLAGCMAAVAAARGGAGTVLIQNRPVLGGNASVEILVPPVGAHRRIRESGLIEEIRTAGNQRASESWVYSGRLKRLVDAEENLDLFLNTHATGVEMKSGVPDAIAAVLAVDTRCGRRMRFPGRIFIDCTGDGVIGIWAGAEYRHGREARSVHNESLAPEAGNRHTMGNSLKFAARRTDAPKPFATPPWAHHFPKCSDFGPHRHPSLRASLDWQWLIELGGLCDTYQDAEEIRDDLLRVIYGMWDHVKNHCPRQKEEAAACELAWVGYIVGKRESNRLIGDYIMTQQDFTSQVLFPDRIAYGGWGLDDHPSAGFFHKGNPSHHVHGFGRVPHSVPYRSIYSKNIGNLLMAGRNISVTHVALGTTRVMLTCGVIGHAAGTAAAVCIEENTTPRGVYQDHITQLQQRLLKDGAYLISLPNRDPRDLARSTEVTASSEASPAASVIDGFARPEAEQSHAWQPRSAHGGPHWVCLTWKKRQTFNTIHVTQLERCSFTIEAWLVEPGRAKLVEPGRAKLDEPGRAKLDEPGRAKLDHAWKTVAQVFDNRFRRNVLAFEDLTTTRVRVVLAEPRAINEIRVYHEGKRQVEIARRAFEVMRTPITGPGFPWADEPVLQVRAATPVRSSSGTAAGLVADKLPGIVLDGNTANRTGVWTHSTHTGPYIGDGYLTDGNKGKGKKSIRFVPKLTKRGKYEVRLAYSAFENRATNTLVTVHAGDHSKTIRINQQKTPPIDGLFFSLGTFDLDATSSIIVSNAGADGYVIVDAVQLIPKYGSSE